MRFRTVPVQMADEVPDGSGVDSRRGSGAFWYRWLTRFRRVPDQKTDEVPRVAGQIADEVLEGSGTKTFQNFKKLLGITRGFISQ